VSVLYKRALASAMLLVGVLTSAPSLAQEQGEVLESVVEGLPERFRHAEATSRGDLLLALGPEGEAPMMQVIALRSAFQRELIKFGQGRWGERGIDHVVEAKDRSVWAISAREVLTRETATAPWRRIDLEPLEERACQEWGQYGTHCQEIIPLGGGRGVVLRPAYGALANGDTVLGTQVVVVAADQDKALGAIALPGLLLGPSVSDSEGGFWVMIRRPQKISNSYKPLRGYLHFTSEGSWEMWNNSKEQLEDVEYKGVAAFEINPEPRKMAPDGEGGFFTVGLNRQLYHIDRAGEALEFGPPQLRCQYCQQLAVAWDTQSRELHVLTAQWRDASGKRQLYEGLRWWRFDSRGQVISQSTVPGGDKRDDFFYDQVSVRANNGSVWVLGPKLWAHQDGRVWTRLISGQSGGSGKVNGQTGVVGGSDDKKDGVASAVGPTIGTVGGIGLATAGVLGALYLAEPNERTTAIYSWGFGVLGAYYPAMFSLPYTAGAASGEPVSWGCLGGGFAGMTLLGGFASWGSAELFNRSQDTSGSYETDTRRLGGSMGGAAIGSLAAFGAAKLIYGDEPDATKDTGVVLLGSALVSSFATFGYYLVASMADDDGAGDDNGGDSVITIDGLRRAPLRPPLFQTSVGFSW
jgi:hypothetical protein